jgi:hypothetical protein
MEKYGYEPDEAEGTKTASEKRPDKCPICGEPVTGNPPVCPEHGSTPFEKPNG